MKTSLSNKLKKKKNKLNLIGQKMKEAFGKNDLRWTINSNYIENELKIQQDEKEKEKSFEQ